MEKTQPFVAVDMGARAAVCSVELSAIPLSPSRMLGAFGFGGE